jgi:flagellar biosynthesis GTPase FlhF
MTTGQEVPDDIEIASQERLSRLILKLDEVHA